MTSEGGSDFIFVDCFRFRGLVAEGEDLGLQSQRSMSGDEVDAREETL